MTYSELHTFYPLLGYERGRDAIPGPESLQIRRKCRHDFSRCVTKVSINTTRYNDALITTGLHIMIVMI
jgi:hypothetical protein